MGGDHSTFTLVATIFKHLRVVARQFELGDGTAAFKLSFPFMSFCSVKLLLCTKGKKDLCSELKLIRWIYV